MQAAKKLIFKIKRHTLRCLFGFDLLGEAVDKAVPPYNVRHKLETLNHQASSYTGLGMLKVFDTVEAGHYDFLVKLAVRLIACGVNGKEGF